MSKRTSIRIPDDLYTQLVARAKREQRTISNLIVAILTQNIKDDDATAQHTTPETP